MSLQFSSHTQKKIEHLFNIDQGISNSFTFDTYFNVFFIYLYVLLSFD